MKELGGRVFETAALWFSLRLKPVLAGSKNIIRSILSQFHQHFTRVFFCTKANWAHFLLLRLALQFFEAKISAKKLCVKCWGNWLLVTCSKVEFKLTISLVTWNYPFLTLSVNGAWVLIMTLKMKISDNNMWLMIWTWNRNDDLPTIFFKVRFLDTKKLYRG